MSFYNNFLIKTILPIADKLMKTEFTSFYNSIDKMSYWSKIEIIDWQNRKLSDLISHAYQNTLYYHEVMKNMGITPKNIQSFDDLKKLPILRKHDIIGNFSRLVPKTINNIKFKTSATGGSSGDPLKFYLDYRAKSYTTACTMYYWHKLGYNYGEKYIALGSTSLMVNQKINLKHRLYNKLRGRIPLNGINLSNDVLETYLNLIIKNKIKFIYGYASAIFLFASYVIEKKVRIDFIKACFTTSEILTQKYREIIKTAFDCEILDCYGASDGGVMAYALSENQFHVCYNSILQVHDTYEPNAGKLLCTDLFNYAMPFINYEIGDELKLASPNHNYDHNGQVIEELLGRLSDVFRLGNGRVITGPGFTILFRDVNVAAYRMKLIDPFNILVELQRTNNYNSDNEQTILSSIKKQAGEECNVIIKYVNGLSNLSNGKINYFMI